MVSETICGIVSCTYHMDFHGNAPKCPHSSWKHAVAFQRALKFFLAKIKFGTLAKFSVVQLVSVLGIWIANHFSHVSNVLNADHAFWFYEKIGRPSGSDHFLQWNCCSEIEVVSILLVVQHDLGLTCLQVCFDYLLGCQRYDFKFQLSFFIQMFGLQQKN